MFSHAAGTLCDWQLSRELWNRGRICMSLLHSLCFWYQKLTFTVCINTSPAIIIGNYIHNIQGQLLTAFLAWDNNPYIFHSFTRVIDGAWNWLKYITYSGWFCWASSLVLGDVVKWCSYNTYVEYRVHELFSKVMTTILLHACKFPLSSPLSLLLV